MRMNAEAVLACQLKDRIMPVVFLIWQLRVFQTISMRWMN